MRKPDAEGTENLSSDDSKTTETKRQETEVTRDRQQHHNKPATLNFVIRKVLRAMTGTTRREQDETHTTTGLTKPRPL